MTIAFSHSTALAYLRSLAVDDRLARTRASAPTISPAGIGELRDTVRGTSFGEPPFHHIVSVASARIRNRGAASHLCTFPLPPRSLLKVSPDVFSSTPELCFMQLANSLTMVQLIELGYELCGHYVLDQNDIRGFRMRDPLTTTSKIDRFARKSSGMPGCKKVRRAIRFIVDESASPMETKLTMLLCLPSSLGGFALPFPRLNHPISVTGRTPHDPRRHYVCDLYWPAAKLAVEYDSDMFHTGSERIARDAERRRALIAKGLTVVSATKSHVLDANKTESLARLIASKLDIRIRTTRPDSMMRRYALRNELLQS